MNFQYWTLIIACVLLILMLVMIGTTLYKTRFSGQSPSVLGSCPDYWTLEKIKDEATGKTTEMCVNTHHLGGCSEQQMDFTDALWSGSKGLCRKKKWAERCNLTWDGITENNEICKDKQDNL
jgi:hypothetical protein